MKSFESLSKETRFCVELLVSFVKITQWIVQFFHSIPNDLASLAFDNDWLCEVDRECLSTQGHRATRF